VRLHRHAVRAVSEDQVDAAAADSVLAVEGATAVFDAEEERHEHEVRGGALHRPLRRVRGRLVGDAMSLFHEFLVRPRAIVDKDFWPTGDPDALVIHDEVLGLLWQALEFIPSYNPCLGEPMHGLNRWGLTTINGEGATVAAQVFRARADLYAAGPPQLRIVGPVFSTTHEPDDERNADGPPQLPVVDEDFSASEPDDELDTDWLPYGIGVGLSHRVLTDERGNGYIRLDIDRNALVAVLRRLAEWCDRVAADDELCLVHLGI